MTIIAIIGDAVWMDFKLNQTTFPIDASQDIVSNWPIITDDMKCVACVCACVCLTAHVDSSSVRVIWHLLFKKIGWP